MNEIRLTELDFLNFLSGLRTPALDLIFGFITLFGSEYFYMILVPLCFAVLCRKNAYNLVSITLISLFINWLLKETLAIPRPPDSIAVNMAGMYPEGFSMPSGHAQGSITLWGYVAIFLRKDRKTQILCAVIIFLISFSRLYLGVHYPSDIIAGWIIGALLLTAYKYFQKINDPYLYMAAIFLSLSFFIPYARAEKLSSILAGINIGMQIGGKINTEIFQKIKSYQRAAGIILTSLLVFLTLKLILNNNMIIYGFTGLWISFGFPFIAVKTALPNP